jgi:hypothetical protein
MKVMVFIYFFFYNFFLYYFLNIDSDHTSVHDDFEEKELDEEKESYNDFNPDLSSINNVVGISFFLFFSYRLIHFNFVAY